MYLKTDTEYLQISQLIVYCEKARNRNRLPYLVPILAVVRRIHVQGDAIVVGG